MLQNAWDYLQQRITRTQLARFGVSLVIALLLWGWVTQLQDPVETQRYAEIAISEPDLPGTMQIVTTLPRATVSIKDVASRLDHFGRADITVSLDTSRVTKPGSYQLPVIAETSEKMREVRVSPDTVSVQVEEEISKNFPLTVENQVLADDARRIVDINPEVSEVTVTGTQSAVNRIARVVLPVTIGDQTNDFVDMIDPYAVDSDGQRIQEVSILPAFVRTEVVIETRGKTVSIVPQVTGTPADGYTVQQQVAVPASVVVDGPQNVIDKLLFLNTEPVDITGAKESLSRTVAIADLPEGVTLVEPKTNKIEVRVSIATAGNTANVIPSMPVRVVNAPAGMHVTVDPSAIDIDVSAASDTLASLTPDDVSVTVDLTGLKPGVYTLTPDVQVPDNVNVIQLDPSRVVVLIADQAATPVSRASPSSD